MRLIPGFNSPGHMNVILRAMEILKIPSPHFVNEGQKSETTIDLNNELAITFTKALFTKYVDFFADKVDAFNLGADEYAIHLKQGERHLGGFDVLQEKGLFTKFVTYVNDLAKIIKAKGLVPMAFNDGFYYNQDQTAFDNDIIVAYWQAPGGNNKGANALEISKKGHKILNTNADWYFVLGQTNSYSGYFNAEKAKKNMQSQKFTHLHGFKNEDGKPSSRWQYDMHVG